MSTPQVINNLRPGNAPAWQIKAWGEFLDMVLERAQALRNKQESPGANQGLKEGEIKKA